MTRDASVPPSLPADPARAPALTPVLDTEAGVERLMGNRAVYLRALARFRQDYRHAIPALRGALDASDTDQARRLAHTLKGAAGMIEAQSLYTAALALEHALRDGSGSAGALLVGVDAALAEVVRALDAMVLEEPAAQGPVPGDSVARLRAMLDIGDGAAVELVGAAQGELRAYLGQGEFEKLGAAVAQFDYERALELIDRSTKAG